MAISAGKTVTNCQFSPKMSIETMFTKMTKSVFLHKSSTGKFTSCHSLMCAKPKTRVALWSVTPIITKLAILEKKRKYSLSEKWWLNLLKLGFIRWTPSIYQQILKTNEKRQNLIKGWQSYTVLMTLKNDTKRQKGHLNYWIRTLVNVP